MTKLTDREETVCKDLVESGHVEMSEFMREHYLRDHQIFEELKHVDVDTLYGPAVSETLRNALKKAIAGGDHSLVRALHSFCLTVDKPNKQSSATETEASSSLGATIGFSLLAFSALVVLISLFLGL